MANATIGTVAYRDGGVIAVPVTFAENVIAPSKSVFRVERVSGDELTGVEYRLIGQNTAFALIFEMPPDRKGSFRVSASGDVYKVSSSGWDTVVLKDGNDLTIDHSESIPYNTKIPVLKTFDIPANYIRGQRFDVVLQYMPAVTLNNPVTHFGDSDATYLDFFIFEGANLGIPTIYRKTDNTFPELPIAENLGTAWTDQALQTVDATIYLIRWASVENDATGIFNITIKPQFVRGPVS